MLNLGWIVILSNVGVRHCLVSYCTLTSIVDRIEARARLSSSMSTPSLGANSFGRPNEDLEGSIAASCRLWTTELRPHGAFVASFGLCQNLYKGDEASPGILINGSTVIPDVSRTQSKVL